MYTETTTHLFYYHRDLMMARLVHPSPVYMFDPTPRAQAHVMMTKKVLSTKEVPVLSGKSMYELENGKLAEIR